MRFENSEPFKIGDKYLNDFGEVVEIVGIGLAGMPEVKLPSGMTCLESPLNLKKPLL